MRNRKTEMTTRKLLPINIVMRAFKEAHDIDADDASWDKKFYSRHIRAATDLLNNVFDGDYMKANLYINEFGMKMKCTQIGTNWGFEAVSRAASTTDYLRLFGGNNGLAESKVESTSLDGRGRNREIASPREIVSDALRTLKASGVRPEGTRDMGGSREDNSFDHETFS